MNNQEFNNTSENKSLISLKTVIRTKNFEDSKKFYNELLNLNVVEEYDDENGSKGCIMSFGFESHAFVEISEIKSTHSYFQPAFTRTVDNDKIDIQIKTESVDFWAEKLKGIWKTRGPVERPWGSRYLYLRDPDGVHIIIYQEK